MRWQSTTGRQEPEPVDRDRVIEVSDLRRRYDGGAGFEAVRGVSFSVERGSLFALLGTNGAGKTSTMELVEGLAQPTEGRVRVLGHDPYRERALVRPRTGVVLQEGGFPADLTVIETARMWRSTLSHPRRVEWALDLVDLGHRARTGVKRLSGGERRRLDLALALSVGVRGFLPKTVSVEVLTDVVRTIHRVGRYVDPQLAAEAISAGDSPLTPREADVLELAAEGAAVEEIAERASLSPGTVRNYLSSAAGKIGAANRHEAAQIARRFGWI